MTYDSVRAQLDKLLGPDRNGPLASKSTASTDYRHPEICKFFLLGFCPADLHIKHRSEPGSCKQRHSDSAKAAFQRDLSSQRACRENARWTESLLSECYTIIADEDRRVRCHARRLMETYNVKGDLSGLVIQSFDTLKKLGMVRKNARIRVLCEAERHETNAGPVSKDLIDEQYKQSIERDTFLVEHDRLPSPKDQAEAPLFGRKANDPCTKRSGGKCCPPSETGDCNVAGGNGDDDCDFGLIKVTPASNETHRDFGGPKSLTSIYCAPFSELSHLNRSHLNDLSSNLRSVSARDEHGQTRGVNFTTHGKRRLGDCSLAEVAGKTESAGNSSPAKSKVDDSISVREGSDNSGHRIAENVVQETCSDDEESFLCNVPEMVLDDRNTQEGELNRMTISHRMAFFYERGVGPDGLLMLDKKQSLRVCACCGGYISLVDAESRLLSHYGGKSHCSMALLRQKVRQLEARMLAETRNRQPPTHPYAGPQSRERFRLKTCLDEGGRPLGSRHAKSPEGHVNRCETRSGDRLNDRRRAKYRENTRGFGTSDWYNNYLSEFGASHSLQRGDGYQNLEISSPQHQERWFGRKRHRSRSPIRKFRRPRGR